VFVPVIVAKGVAVKLHGFAIVQLAETGGYTTMLLLVLSV
jgi:hypothetical protein